MIKKFLKLLQSKCKKIKFKPKSLLNKLFMLEFSINALRSKLSNNFSFKGDIFNLINSIRCDKCGHILPEIKFDNIQDQYVYDGQIGTGTVIINSPISTDSHTDISTSTDTATSTGANNNIIKLNLD